MCLMKGMQTRGLPPMYHYMVRLLIAKVAAMLGTQKPGIIKEKAP